MTMQSLASKPMPISAEERARRAEAVTFARGSVRFEGFELDAAVEDLNRRFIDGELTQEEYLAAITAP